MSSARDIRNKISGIKNTKKITKAMELVAASKMRKAQEQMERSKPYANKMRQVVRHLARSKPEYQHTYLTKNENFSRVGLIMVSTDRGLCGSLNINLFKSAVKQMQQWQDNDIDTDMCVIGHKGQTFFQRFGANIEAVSDKIGDSPGVSDLVGVVKVMLNAFEEGQIGEVYIGANQFINTMSQKPYIEKLLPVEPAEDDEADAQEGTWDYIYEPEAKSLLDHVLRRYIESLVYQAVVENISCEQAARMIAMKNATDNADDIINDLQLAYNKARQAAITQEISEIVSGAGAV